LNKSIFYFFFFLFHAQVCACSGSTLLNDIPDQTQRLTAGRSSESLLLAECGQHATGREVQQPAGSSRQTHAESPKRGLEQHEQTAAVHFPRFSKVALS